MELSKIGFIGGGNMASAIINGIVSKGMYAYSDIYVSDISQDRLAHFGGLGMNTTDDNVALVKNSDIIVLAIKPNVAEEVLDDIHKYISSEKVVISIMAGWPTEKLASCLPENARIMRVMPNTPALVGAGMSVLSADNELEPEQLEKVVEIFSALGEVEIIEEKHMDAVTAVSGSGPAYVYMFIDALADAGVYEGLPKNIALKLAAQTVLGSAKVVVDTQQHPCVLKDAVCSPGGTTIEAVASLEQAGFRSAIMNAAIKCAEKSRELTQNATMTEKILEQFIDDIEADDDI